MILLKLLVILLVGLSVTPFVIKLSKKLKIVDKPDKRKVHKSELPRLGGIAIIISFIVGIFLFKVWDIHTVNEINLFLVSIGTLMIITIGILDDKFVLGAKIKFLVQLIAAYIVVLSGVKVEVINLPIVDISNIELGIFSIPFSILWIVGITNAINLIDGLDGLSSGISIISLSGIVFMSYMMGDIFICTVSLILIFSILGFMKYNFFPAKIFMGDNGSLFLGFMIGMITLVSYKNMAVFSVLVPLFILAVPIVDTALAIVRRLLNKKPIGEADKNHLHHCLMEVGVSHKNTVLLIYLISILFNVGAILLSENLVWLTLIVLIISFILIEILMENTNIISNSYKPFRNMLYKIKEKIKK